MAIGSVSNRVTTAQIAPPVKDVAVRPTKVRAEYYMPGGAYNPNMPRRQSGLYLHFNLPKGTNPKMSIHTDPKKHVVTVTLGGHAAKKPAPGATVKTFEKGPYQVNPGIIGNFTIIVKDESGRQLYKGTGNNMPRP